MCVGDAERAFVLRIWGGFLIPVKVYGTTEGPFLPSYPLFHALLSSALLRFSSGNEQPKKNTYIPYTAGAEGGHSRSGADWAGEHDGGQGLRSGGVGCHGRVRRAAQGRERSERHNAQGRCFFLPLDAKIGAIFPAAYKPFWTAKIFQGVENLFVFLFVFLLLFLPPIPPISPSPGQTKRRTSPPPSPALPVDTSSTPSHPMPDKMHFNASSAPTSP